jgi:hypothetical protein
VAVSLLCHLCELSGRGFFPRLWKRRAETTYSYYSIDFPDAEEKKREMSVCGNQLQKRKDPE